MTKRQSGDGAPAAGPLTRRECARRWRAAVKHWADAFGLTGQWHFQCDIRRPEQDGQLAQEGIDAYCAVDRTHGLARINVSELVRPEYYPTIAAHEVLHVLLDPLDCAFDEIAQPARAMLEIAEHRIVQRLSLVLAGQGPWDGRERGLVPPWEHEAGTKPKPPRQVGT